MTKKRFFGAGKARCVVWSVFFLAGCTMENPGFGLSQTGGETTGLETSAGPSTATDDTSTATQTGDSTGGQTSSSSGTTDSTTDVDPTTSTTTQTTGDSESDSEVGSDTEADSDESDTDNMGEVVKVILPATLAVCVLLAKDGAPHAGPEQCEQIVSLPELFETQGIIANDTALFAGGGLGREARMFVKLNWPPELTDKEILTLKLELNVYGDANSAGDLWLSQPFTKQTLADGPADLVMELLPNTGPIEAGEVRFFELDPEVWAAAQPLHLVFVPDSSDGSFYWSSSADDPELRPSFHISYH